MRVGDIPVQQVSLGAADVIENVSWVFRERIAALGDVAVGADEHERALVGLLNLSIAQCDGFQRKADCAGGGCERGRVHVFSR